MALNSSLLLPGAFDQRTDNWAVYKEQMLFALQALGVQDNLESARAIFLSQCGKETFAFLTSLVAPRKLVEVDFSDILALLDGFYAPEKNEILEAGKFHARCQQKGETILAFISAIKSLAVKCNFVDLERQLRDRLVLGVIDVRLRRELLKTENLTFTQAVGRSVTYEQTAAELYPTQPTPAPLETRPTTTYEPMDTCNVNVGSRKRDTTCRHCGANHNSRGCKFAKANCNYCKKVGHTVAVCWNRRKKVNLVEVEDLDGKEDFSYMNEILQIHTKSNGDKILTTVTLNEKQVQFEVDSGAARTIISIETWEKLQLKQELQEAKIKLITWTRQPIKLKGTFEVVVQYKGLTHKLPILVAEDSGPNILGRDWFTTLGIEVQGLCWTHQVSEDLQMKYPQVFSDRLGCYTGPPVKLMLKPDAQPRFLKCRPIPFALKDEVKVELKRLESIGVLTPVRYSDWATPLRIVRKEDGTLRICGDYRSTVNTSISCDMYPLPTATEAFQLLAGGRVFSKLDLKQAYTQLLVDEESAVILTWNTPLGLMKVNRLAFGVNAAPGIFQRVMSSQFADMDGVAVLLDDIVVTGADKSEHDARLHKVLQRIEELGFTLNVKKCHFEVPTVTFLGYVLDANGIHPCPIKTKEIQERPSPSDLKQLRAFLGLFNFYERFYKDKSDILEPLHQLLKKDTPWKWGRPEEEAFRKAKQLLTSDLTLMQFDKKKKIVLTCDASEYGVGAVISHILDDGQERPIAMASRTMQPHERKYSQLDKEALAIMFAVKKFHCYLGGMKFTIVTDHKPLVGLMDPRKPIPDQISPRLLRWLLMLSTYEYNIVYKPGQQIQNADGLSRWCSAEPVRNEAPLPEVLLLEEKPEGWTVSVEDIARETGKDELLKKVMFFVLHGWPSEVNDRALRPYSQRKEAISVSKDCLLFSNRVIIPEKLQGQVLSIIHAPHAGIVRSKAYARAYVYWPGLDADITETVELCERCQLTRNNPSATVREWAPTEKPWQRLHIDFAGPYMNKVFLIVIDAYSKWPEVEILQSMATANVIQCLRKIFAEQGLPDMIVSDNGTSFVAEEFQKFLKRNSIEHRTSPPYHPSSNGQAERTVQTIKNSIKCQSELPWPERLAKLLYHLRNLPSTVTGKTPAELLNNRKFRTALSTLHPETCTKKITQTPNKRLRQFSVGQTVYVRKYNNKMEKWMKGIVVEQRGLTIYEVKTEDGVVQQRHVDQMRARRDQSVDQESESDTTPKAGTADGWTRDPSQETDPPIVIPPEKLSNVIGELMQEYGDVWRFWLGPDLNIIVSDPEDVKNLLTNSKTSIKGPQYKYMVDYLGEGILSGSGPTWRMRRKIALPNYGRRAVEGYEEVFNREADVTLARLRSKTGATFDIYDDVVIGTTYTVCQALLGLTKQQILDLPHLEMIINESHELYLLVFMRMTTWYLQIEPFYRVTKHYQKQVNFIKKIHEMVDVIVRHRLKVLETMDENRKTELLNSEGDNKHNTELSVVDRLVLSNTISSYEEMLREIFTVFTSSQEATAKMTSFLFLMMAYHPEYQEKVYAEIKSVFGDSTRDVTDDDIKKMTYLDMVFKEVLRLFPIGVMLQRTVSHDIEISNATLPAGCSLIIPIYHMHRDKRYWTNPNSFDPDRFSPERAKLRLASCYIPFSLGPMDCMGRYFGTKLVKTVCVKVLREFRLTSPETYEDMRLVMAISVASVNGYPVQLHPRKHSQVPV